MMRNLFLTITLLLFFSGCNLREREKALDERAALLDQKEQELVLKERSLQLREEELMKRFQNADSINVKDSSGVILPSLPGTWAVKMVCTEATCPGSAVGDIKNESWQISYQQNNILVRAMAGQQLVRIYSGKYNGNEIELSETREGEPAASSAKMTVRLRIVDAMTLEGHREIIRDANCKTVYSVNMTKQ